MDFFHVNENNKSYTYPILKIIVCIVLIVLCINRDRIIPVDNRVIRIIIGVICVQIVIICIYCVYISAFELSQVHGNRVKENAVSDRVKANGKWYTIEESVSLVEANDIIEIQIVSKSKAIEIGASADCKNGSSRFFDKRYYIDDVMFETIEEFKSEFLSYATNGQLSVIGIDGIAPM